MSFQHPTILYIGDSEDGEMLLQAANARDWHVYDLPPES